MLSFNACYLTTGTEVTAGRMTTMMTQAIGVLLVRLSKVVTGNIAPGETAGKNIASYSRVLFICTYVLTCNPQVARKYINTSYKVLEPNNSNSYIHTQFRFGGPRGNYSPRRRWERDNDYGQSRVDAYYHERRDDYSRNGDYSNYYDDD